MRLTDYTDYTLRVLMFCALNPERSITIAELAESHAVSKNHLMKIVNDLARQGLLQTTRGRGGGLRLLKAAADINIGDVVRKSETDFRMVECFDASHNACTLTAHCQLKQVFKTALQMYLAELDKVTLADITRPKHGRTQTIDRSISLIPVSEIKRLPVKKPARTKTALKK
ncbi:MAG: Rrf2 family transcriptional regulator [Rhodoferax sp.]|uniref:Rrf2 family transcriptional regulator n=1 Tax=Rhodoferax sp. TaxID=50421 RepID=UPI001805FFD8|nr:Rrf2 family transcriptional regulator [Rhodoferax sp.]NMM15205.1 Rrf2 family transcriptional regulator [Rhodoferax sp.]NMM19690.1 Rrf2 family transcriptional regulator [Rhodoferax sp.]